MFTRDEMRDGIYNWINEGTGDREELLDLYTDAATGSLDIQDIIIRCMSEDYDESVLADTDVDDFTTMWLTIVREELIG